MSPDRVKILVEIPKGSRNKYERNPQTGELELDRRLFASVSYPTDYGSVVGTRAGDGDELDALVAVSEPTFPGCVIWGRPVASSRCATRTPRMTTRCSSCRSATRRGTG
jgi:inorganic pyrophosphatase